jgi:hypothetical protein
MKATKEKFGEQQKTDGLPEGKHMQTEDLRHQGVP